MQLNPFNYTSLNNLADYSVFARIYDAVCSTNKIEDSMEELHEKIQWVEGAEQVRTRIIMQYHITNYDAVCIIN